MIPVHLQAQADQLVELARSEIPHIDQVLDARSSLMLSEILAWVNDGAEHVDVRMRLLAVSKLALHIRENPCSNRSSLDSP